MEDFFDGWKKILGTMLLAVAALWIVNRLLPDKARNAIMNY